MSSPLSLPELSSSSESVEGLAGGSLPVDGGAVGSVLGSVVGLAETLALGLVVGVAAGFCAPGEPCCCPPGTARPEFWPLGADGEVLGFVPGVVPSLSCPASPSQPPTSAAARPSTATPAAICRCRRRWGTSAPATPEPFGLAGAARGTTEVGVGVSSVEANTAWPSGEAAATVGWVAVLPSVAGTGSSAASTISVSVPRSTAMHSCADGRSAGSSLVMAASSDGSGARNRVGMSGGRDSRATAASTVAPRYSCCPVRDSSRTKPSE